MVRDFDPHSRLKRSETKGNQKKKERNMTILLITLTVTLMRIIHKLTISLTQIDLAREQSGERLR